MTSYKFGPGTYKTVDGRNATILGRRPGRCHCDLIGYVVDDNFDPCNDAAPPVFTWSRDGKFMAPDSFGERDDYSIGVDLVRPTVKKWRALNENGTGSFWHDKKEYALVGCPRAVVLIEADFYPDGSAMVPESARVEVIQPNAD